jgi:hypothetical protein
MLMMRTKGGTVVLGWRGWNKKDLEKLYRELCRQGGELLEAFEKREPVGDESIYIPA